MSNELIFKDWMTSTEIASLKLKDMPTTRRGVLDTAIKGNWDETDNARIRKGSKGGGGYEYHIDLLPEAACTDLIARRDKARALKQLAKKSEMVGSICDPSKAIGKTKRDLKGRHEAIGNARYKLILHIETQMALQAQSQRQVVLSLIENYNKEQKARGNGDIGKYMDGVLFDIISWANDKKDGIATKA